MMIFHGVVNMSSFLPIARPLPSKEKFYINGQECLHSLPLRKEKEGPGEKKEGGPKKKEKRKKGPKNEAKY
jgi:hypothetical protein